jgi:hypothetical protein
MNARNRPDEPWMRPRADGQRTLDRVYRAVADGCDTSVEVAARTGLRTQTVSANLSVLHRAGYLVHCGQVDRDREGKRRLVLWDVAIREDVERETLDARRDAEGPGAVAHVRSAITWWLESDDAPLDLRTALERYQ